MRAARSQLCVVMSKEMRDQMRNAIGSYAWKTTMQAVQADPHLAGRCAPPCFSICSFFLGSAGRSLGHHVDLWGGSAAASVSHLRALGAVSHTLRSRRFASRRWNQNRR